MAVIELIDRNKEAKLIDKPKKEVRANKDKEVENKTEKLATSKKK